MCPIEMPTQALALQSLQNVVNPVIAAQHPAQGWAHRAGQYCYTQVLLASWLSQVACLYAGPIGLALLPVHSARSAGMTCSYRLAYGKASLVAHIVAE